MQTRTGSCDVVCIERSSRAMKRGGRRRLAAIAQASAMTVKVINSAVVRNSSVEPLSSSGDQDDGAQLAEHADRDHVAAQVRLQQVRVAQDRHQRAERRGRERRRHELHRPSDVARPRVPRRR